MNRKVVLWGAGIGAVVAIAALVAYRRREALRAAVPAWLNPQQPPENIAAELLTVSEAESWAANRCRHITGACRGQTAGWRIRRTYPDSLAAADYSFVQASFDVGM